MKQLPWFAVFHSMRTTLVGDTGHLLFRMCGHGWPAAAPPLVWPSGLECKTSNETSPVLIMWRVSAEVALQR